MSELAARAERIGWPDHDAETAASRHGRRIGALDDLVRWLAGVQGSYPPAAPRRPRLVVFAADHGVALEDVSLNRVGHATASAQALRSGSLEPAGIAAGAGVGIVVVESALSGRIDQEDALPLDEVEKAIALGGAVADQEIDAGADLLIVASVGAGSSTCAATLISVLTAVEPIRCVGRGSGIGDAAWMRKASIVRDARRRGWPHRSEPLDLLRVVGGADVAAMVGFALHAAARRTPVLLDGVLTAAAALVAASVQPRIPRWQQVPQLTPEPAQRLAANQLGLVPIVDLGLSIADGTGGLLALPLVQTAVRLHLADV